MYDFLDRPVTGLDQGGRFLIWAMRNWVAAISERRCAGGMLAGAFRKWNMLPGLQPFLRLMAGFNRHGLESFQFCALRCNHISEHEAIIISLICLLRDGRPEALKATLGLLVEEQAIGDLFSALSSLGLALNAADICPGRVNTDYTPTQARPQWQQPGQ